MKENETQEYIKQYEDLKRNRYIIEAIEPDFFFEIVDCLLEENKKLKNDIANMYDEEVVTSIISDNFNLSKNEVLELLGGD